MNFERYTFGVSVIIITLHNCLKWLLTMSPNNLSPLRWTQRFNIFDIKFELGVNHTDADGLYQQL